MRTKKEIAADKARTGRPALPNSEKRSVKFTFRLTPKEMSTLRARSKAAGKEVADFVRELVLRKD